MKKILVYITCSVFLWTGIISAETLKIATDVNIWYPYSYVENDESKGLHVDIVTLALKNLGHEYVINQYPWKRCLMYAEKGLTDAIISASYKKERAEFLAYPPHADMPGKAEYRVTQAQYSIVSNIKDSYDFDGNMKSLPRPVMAPLGYSIVDDIKKEGVPVLETTGDLKNFQALNSRKGCVITMPQTAEKMMQFPEYKGKFYLSKKPLKSKSYFLVFSQKTTLSESQKLEIWEEVKRIREDKKIMDLFLKKY